jgi:D-alanyl-D-alanine carboxypeptidase/D-alanyl-D-alanine-endopeptidase (penicillin-binding protein 4)
VRDRRNSWDTSKDAAAYFAARLDLELHARLHARTDLAPAAVYGGRLRAPATAALLARFVGNSLDAALHHMLLVSDNDVAEAVFRLTALRARGSATWAAGRATVTAMLTALRVDTRGWVVIDGSGLSRTARLTARGLAQLLAAAQSPTHRELARIVDYLPVAGISGTLATHYHRYDTSPTICARGKVFGKTGGLTGAVALAGYARGKDQRLKAFAVVVDTTHVTATGREVRRSADRVAATATGCY